MSYSRNKIRSSRKNTLSSIETLSSHDKWIVKSGITPDKWQEIEEDEENLMVVLYIREKLLEEVLDTAYDNYLEKQVNPFIVECSYMAWKQLISWYFQRRDPGEPKGIDCDTWKGDKEPPTSEPDAWSSHIIPVVTVPCNKHRPRHSVSKYSTIDPWKMLPNVSLSIDGRVASMESIEPIIKTTDSPYKIRRRYKYPLCNTIVIDNAEKSYKASFLEEARKDSVTFPSPIYLHPKHFPSSRVDVQYAIKPDHQTKSNVYSNNGPVVKNIVLKKDPETENKYILKIRGRR